MFQKLMMLSGALLLLTAPAALADPVSPFNDRPQPVGIAPAGELGLQQILNQIYGASDAPDASSGQQAAAVWQLPGGAVGSSVPTIQFEEAGNRGENIFGIWSGTDTGSIVYAPIFGGVASVGDVATIKWLPGDSNSVIIDSPNNAFDATISGINRYLFGFYLEGPGTTSGTDGKFWTADQLNPSTGAYPGGTPQAMAYFGPVGKWTLAFEDVAIGSGDGDHNDFVVTVESLAPVPEPATIVLFGTMLTCTFAVLRRRQRA